MLDQMKAMGAIAGLLKNKERLREVGERTRQRLESARLVGQAGGGAVQVEITGKMTVLDVRISEPALAALANDNDTVRRLIVDATNDAIEKAQRLLKEEANRAADELGLPDSPEIRGMLEQI